MDQTEQQRLVAECRASGTTAKAWCEKRGIPYHRYTSWATRLNRQAQTKPQQQWIEISPAKGNGVVDEIHLNCGKWSIKVNSGFNPSLLADIIRIVDGVC